ncbi:EAL domain-containing protein [Vreelandella lutescens]|uniref:Diguanylate cyclase n=1 Tax=Vreelandella lutescens TaxID=1602943 RepID=A0ABQ1PBE6_9GAMM|nr:EAL domain-containing protein [Halomonas lutescens]GGC92196.1 diguanylate cyclase [Halomonas lutescens]
MPLSHSDLLMILPNLLLDPQALSALQGKHDIPLVMLSWLVALAASFASLEIIRLVGRISSSLWRRTWLIAGASVMGAGVWSMHFVGMHAYRLDFHVSHSHLLTLLSILPAIVGSLVAMTLLCREHLTHRTLIIAGTSLGLGIGVMHYSGMAAMRMPATLYYALDLFLASLVVAVGLGVLSAYAYRLCRMENGKAHYQRYAFLSALCISLAVSGMHYVAMQAAWFVPLEANLPHDHMMASHWLIYAISGAAVFAALLTLLAIKIQRRLQDSERHGYMTQRRLLEVIAALQDGVVLFDDNARIRLCNNAFEQLTGMTHAQLIDSDITQVPYAKDSQALTPAIHRALVAEGEWSGMVTALRSNGDEYPAWLSISRVNYANSKDRDYVALLSDRTDEQNAQQRIRYLAFHDMLTGLPNRLALQEYLTSHLQDTQQKGRYSFLALLDINRFKVLNDSMGQDIGDELLRQLGSRLQQQAGGQVYAARLDGNEFALCISLTLTEHGAAEQQAYQHIDSILASLTADYQLHGHTYPCKINVGMLIFCHREIENVGQLFKRAGLALLEAKRQRDGEPKRFCSALEQKLEEQLTLERELRIAIDSGALSLHLQPQVGAQQEVIGAEALVRWLHPQQGMISPGRFIPIAEQTGLILPLGAWVLKEGCRLLGEWQYDPRLRDLKLSLNVSVRQFQQPSFVEQVISTLRDTSAPPERLTLELTESLLMSDPEGTIDKMLRLRQLGIRFALDDFGTGYSSLAYLKSLPLDTLKIDIAFVKDLTLDMQATPIAATIIALAESLGLDVVAEGVETADQCTVLAHLGCHVYQGYYFGKPVPAAEFTRLNSASSFIAS